MLMNSPENQTPSFNTTTEAANNIGAHPETELNHETDNVERALTLINEAPDTFIDNSPSGIPFGVDDLKDTFERHIDTAVDILQGDATPDNLKFNASVKSLIEALGDNPEEWDTRRYDLLDDFEEAAQNIHTKLKNKVTTINPETGLNDNETGIVRAGIGRRVGKAEQGTKLHDTCPHEGCEHIIALNELLSLNGDDGQGKEIEEVHIGISSLDKHRLGSHPETEEAGALAKKVLDFQEQAFTVRKEIGARNLAALNESNPS